MGLSDAQIAALQKVRAKAKRIKDRAYDMPRSDPYDPNSVWAEFQQLAAEVEELIGEVLGEDDARTVESTD